MDYNRTTNAFNKRFSRSDAEFSRTLSDTTFSDITSFSVDGHAEKAPNGWKN